MSKTKKDAIWKMLEKLDCDELQNVHKKWCFEFRLKNTDVNLGELADYINETDDPLGCDEIKWLLRDWAEEEY